MRKKKTFGSEIKTVSASGIIVPVEWDTQGNPTRMALSTDDEHEYVIDRRSKKGNEMAKLLRAQVQVEGILNEKGSIIVKRYECIDIGRSEAKTHRSAELIDILLPILIFFYSVVDFPPLIT
ncbi:MAG TPA: hypothetical protein HPQ03_08825 [Deltaproteobacteria bacterium]|nr:hypothetical protein [Deltaproteobacteria bacterium]